MHMIVYSSEYIARGGSNIEDILDDIMATATRRNTRDEITGVLFYVDGHFLQIIEGEQNKISKLMSDIKQDARHKNITIHFDVPVEMRGFSDWSMNVLHLGAGKRYSQDDLKKLSENFKQNFQPRSDILAYFYKNLLVEMDISKSA
jgi:hypothetical protein